MTFNIYENKCFQLIFIDDIKITKYCSDFDNKHNNYPQTFSSLLTIFFISKNVYYSLYIKQCSL